jgi:hypothetical protein
MAQPGPPVPAVWNVFLSSTVRDLQTYRKNISDACKHRAQTICLLGEGDWAGGYDDTVAKCLDQIQAANGFFLILGYWYGAIPDKKDGRSITHIEFEAAMAKWRAANPRPMAVMRPTAGSRADKELRKAAQAILETDQVDVASHDQALAIFRAAVMDSWRTVDDFIDRHDLRELAIARCLQFKGHTLIAAATGEVPVARAPIAAQVSDGQLGALGRGPHLAAARAILAQVADRPDVPAVAMLAAGDEDAGQRAFMQRLIATVLKKYSPRRDPSMLPLQFDAGMLTGWIAQLVGVELAPAGLAAHDAVTPQQLAHRVAEELKRQPLYFCIDRIGDLADGLAGFREQFWVPFYDALVDLRQRKRLTHRLVALIAAYSPDDAQLASATAEPHAADYTRLLRLPELAMFTRADLLEWFDEQDVPDEPAGRRAALADRVMKESKGIPLRAFNRLRGETLWPSGEADD